MSLLAAIIAAAGWADVALCIQTKSPKCKLPTLDLYGPRLTPSLPACSNVYINYVNEVTTQVISQYYNSSSTTYNYNEIQQIVQQIVNNPGTQAVLPGTDVTISAQGEHVLGACPACLVPLLRCTS